MCIYIYIYDTIIVKHTHYVMLYYIIERSESTLAVESAAPRSTGRMSPCMYKPYIYMYVQ